MRSTAYTASMQSNSSLRSNGGNDYVSPMEKSPSSKRRQFGVIDLRPGAILSEQNGLSTSNQSCSHSSREPSQPVPLPQQEYRSVANYDVSKSSSGSQGSYGRGEVQPTHGGHGEVQPTHGVRGEVQPAWRAVVLSDEVKKISDNSSLSSYSSRCSSPNKMPSHRSSYASHSSSSPPNTPPSPCSPTHLQRRPSPAASPPPAPTTSSKLPALALEMGGGIDHTPLSGSLIRGSRLTLRRQVSAMCTLGREFVAPIAFAYACLVILAKTHSWTSCV